MKNPLILLPAFVLGTVAANGQMIVYAQSFDNTVNQISYVTGAAALPGWSAANDGGLSQDTTGRQFGLLSSANGVGGDPGFAYAFSGDNDLRAFAAWFAGDLQTPTNPMSLAQSDLVSLSAHIGHGNADNQSRWLIRIDNAGTDNWFVSRETYTRNVGNAAGFEAGNIQISANFSDLTWRPLFAPNGTDPFDGLNLEASSGFTRITNAANPAASILPSGSITAIGMYHWHSVINTATRFDDFTITAIPEPSTYAALIGLLALGLVAWRRRR